MNGLSALIGMIVDLSHVAPSVMHQSLDLTTLPVIFSHSCARGLNPHPRNIPDDVADRVLDRFVERHAARFAASVNDFQLGLATGRFHDGHHQADAEAEQGGADQSAGALVVATARRADRLDELPDEDCVEFDTGIRKSGHCIASEALESVESATTVRVRNGKVSVIDGPFAETKEQLGGIQILEARDLNHAVQLISQAPGFKYGLGPVEIRPAAELNEMMKASEQRRRKDNSR
mgnify:CR=1 FL=1